MDNLLFERVAELCKEKGISQRKLQEEMGMSTGALSKWKTSMPNADLLQRVANYFNVTVDYLTGRTKYRNKEHMLQSFDENFKPNMNDTDVPLDYCIQTAEGIMLIEGKAPAPRYIDPATRQIAERLMDDERLKTIMENLTNLKPEQLNTVYNMVMMFGDK